MRLAFLSKTPGIGGSLKESPEDFLVEEITPEGKVIQAGKPFSEKGKEGGFTHFALEKKNWNTSQALQALARELRVSQKRLASAGIKDRNAVTTQACSAFRVEPENLMAVRLKDIRVLGAWKEKDGIKIGGLLGNRFRIVVRGAGKDALKKAKKIAAEIDGMFPNYFGEQRFGALRRNTHLVGKALVKGDLKEAALNYLCFEGEEEEADASAARRQLAEEMDFQKALSFFPQRLKYERTMLGRLAQNPKDYAGALRALPRPLLLMFAHAFQSMLFNKTLSDRLEEGSLKKEGGEYWCGAGKAPWKFPDLGKKAKKGFLAGKILGFDSKPNEREKKVLEEEEIALEDFKVRSMPELNCKGVHRTLLAPLSRLKISQAGEGALEFSFALPPGSYATSALREFTEGEKQ